MTNLPSSFSSIQLRANERERVLRDHQLFIGGNDPDRQAAVGSGNAGAIGRVSGPRPDGRFASCNHSRVLVAVGNVISAMPHV